MNGKKLSNNEMIETIYFVIGLFLVFYGVLFAGILFCFQNFR